MERHNVHVRKRIGIILFLIHFLIAQSITLHVFPGPGSSGEGIHTTPSDGIFIKKAIVYIGEGLLSQTGVKLHNYINIKNVLTYCPVLCWFDLFTEFFK